jgi:hypothetical protein
MYTINNVLLSTRSRITFSKICYGLYIYSDIQIHKYTNIQIYKYTNIQIHKYTYIQIYKYAKIKYSDKQIHKSTNIQIYTHTQIYKYSDTQPIFSESSVTLKDLFQSSADKKKDSMEGGFRFFF